MSKSNALKQISALMTQYGINADEIIAYHKNNADPQARSSGIVMQVLAYLGGTLIFAGVGIYVHMIWDNLPSLSRVLITFGPGIIALILGILCSKDRRYIKAAASLFLISAFLQPSGILVYMHEYLEGDDEALALIFCFGVMAIQYGVLFTQLKRAALLFFTVIFGFLTAAWVFHWLDMDGDLNAVICGFSLICILSRIDRTVYRSFVPFGYFIGCSVLLIGAYELLDHSTPFDFGLIGLTAGMMYCSTILNSRTMLVMSVIGFLCYLGYYTDEYFEDMVGWPVALIIIGFIMIGLSAFALRLGQRIKQHHDIRA